MKPSFPVLLVDDEESFLRIARLTLASAGLNNIETLSDSRMVMARLSQQHYSLIALDITMPYVQGPDLLEEIASNYPEIPVIMITGDNDIDSAVRCMRLGAFDYMVKPLDPERLVSRFKRALEHKATISETAALKRGLLSGKIRNPDAFDHIITRDPTMHNLFVYLEAIAGTELPILITGETGTGKELMAQAVHRLRGQGSSFVAVNVAGLDDSIFADTLFGHVAGAFTGATGKRKGLVEEAEGGTLFLDEIGDLNNESQVKLLRLIQENEYYPVGSDTPKRSKARLVVASNRDLASSNRFRRDLYYRLQAHEIRLPALRDRPEDIPLLARAFIAEAIEKMGKRPLHVPPEIDSLLSGYHFPGNIRELRGLMYDLVGSHLGGSLSLRPLKERLYGPQQAPAPEPIGDSTLHSEPLTFGARLPSFDEAQLLLISEALKRTNGNKTAAALMLGITRQTLINRLKMATQGT